MDLAYIENQAEEVKPLVAEVRICLAHDITYEKAAEGVQHINALYGEYWSKDNQEILEKICQKPQYCFFVLKNEEVIGYSIIRKEKRGEEHYHVSWIAVDSSQNNCGVGSKLMGAIIDYSYARGYHLLSLSHRLDNPRLIDFYNRIGRLYQATLQRVQTGPNECLLTYHLINDLISCSEVL